MVTCKSCEKTTGKGEVGRHWICLDCRMSKSPKTNSMSAKEDRR